MNTDISGSNGEDALTVSVNSPLFDILDHMADTQPPLVLLDSLLSYRAHVKDAIENAVRDARKAHHTWEEIGTALDISKQAAQQRYGSD